MARLRKGTCPVCRTWFGSADVCGFCERIVIGQVAAVLFFRSQR